MRFELHRTYVFEPEHRKSSIAKKDIYICCSCKKEFHYRKGILNHLLNCNAHYQLIQPCKTLVDKIEETELTQLFIEEFRYFGKGHNHKKHKESITKDSYPLLRILKNTLLFLKKKELHRYLPFKKQSESFYKYDFEENDWITITEMNWMIELMYYTFQLFVTNYEDQYLLNERLEKELFPWCKTIVKDGTLIEDADYNGDFRGDYVNNMEEFYEYYKTKRDQIHTIIYYTNLSENEMLKNEYRTTIQEIL